MVVQFNQRQRSTSLSYYYTLWSSYYYATKRDHLLVLRCHRRRRLLLLLWIWRGWVRYHGEEKRVRLALRRFGGSSRRRKVRVMMCRWRRRKEVNKAARGRMERVRRVLLRKGMVRWYYYLKRIKLLGSILRKKEARNVLVGFLKWRHETLMSTAGGE